MCSYEAKISRNATNTFIQQILTVEILTDVVFAQNMYRRISIIKTHNRQYYECSYEFA